MRIASGSTTKKLPFLAVDATDLKTRETGLSAFTVYRSRDGGTATAWTTPTIAEASSSNMPGLYWLTIDEDTTIAAGFTEETVTLHITCTGMDPVTITYELFRDDLALRSNTAQGGASGSITLDASASSTTDFYKGALVVLTGGTGVGQSRVISAYNGTTKVATVGTNWATAPDSTSTFAVMAADHQTVDTAVAAIKAVTDALPNAGALTSLATQASVNTIDDFLDTEVAAILAAVDTEVGAIKAVTDALPNAGALTSLATQASVNTIDDFLDTEIAAIKAVTDALPNAGALTSLATQASVNTIDDFLDTEIAAIKAKTDNLPAAPAATGDIPTAAAIADAVWDEATSGHATGGTTGAAITAAGSGADAEAIAEAVLDAAAVAPIAADVKQIKTVPLTGTGPFGI